MIIKYKTSLPLIKVAEKIVKELNDVEGMKASCEFIQVVPRHCIITMEVSDLTSVDTIFEIGVFVGTIETAELRNNY